MVAIIFSPTVWTRTNDGFLKIQFYDGNQIDDKIALNLFS